MRNYLKCKSFRFGEVELRSMCLTNLPSRSSYKIINRLDLQEFSAILGTENIRSTLLSADQSELDLLNIDYTKAHRGKSSVALFPQNTDQVSRLLKYCNAESIAVCPQSGNTGLVIGSVPIYDEVIIKLSKLNKIISFDKIANVVHCEAGVILENLQNYLSEQGYCPSIDIASKGSCLIGGNISTNAGGINFVKYGSMRKNVMGIKAVLANGDIIDSLNPLPKNNTGYDLKQLFIGSEGTLGIITECLLKVYPKTLFKRTSMLRFTKFENLINFYTLFRNSFEECICAVEYFDSESMRIQRQYNNQMSPFEINSASCLYLLIEVGGSTQGIATQLEDFLSIHSDLYSEGVIASNENQTKKLWILREQILEANMKAGPPIIYDVSLDLTLFEEVSIIIKKICGRLGLSVIFFGHIGDYNLHINIFDEKLKSFENIDPNRTEIEKELFEYIASVKGSISAEHGIGAEKARYLHNSQTTINIDIMKAIKNSLDPKSILNPYKIFKD